MKRCVMAAVTALAVGGFGIGMASAATGNQGTAAGGDPAGQTMQYYTNAHGAGAEPQGWQPWMPTTNPTDPSYVFENNGQG